MSEPTQSTSALRWWILTAIFVLGGGANMIIQHVPMKDDIWQEHLSLICIFSTAGLLIIWVLIFSRMSWVIRVACLVAGAGILVGLKVYFPPPAPRIDPGLLYDGPTARRDYSPGPQQDHSPADYKLPELKVAADAGPVDLKTTTPQDYPRFLGAKEQEEVDGVELAQDWTANPPRQLWSQPIGLGHSAFSIVGPYAVTQEQRGEYELVTCYEVLTGHVRWVHQDQVRFSEQQGGDGPRATPTIYDGKVYALGATGVLNCLDGATGKALWSRNILEDQNQGNLGWGKSCSPLVYDNLVVVGLGDAPSPSLAAYDRNTGAPVWHAGHDTASYSSPVMATIAGRRQIIVVGTNTVTAHDPADGKQIWEYGWQSAIKVSQPVPLPGDRVFLSCGYGIGCVLLKIKADGDKLIPTELWKRPHMKTQFTNVAVRDGYIYGLDEGILSCLELETGKVMWKGERYGSGQILLVGDSLLVMSDSGRLALVAADPTGPRELGHITALTGKTWNNLALSGKYLLVRNGEQAACYELALRSGKGATTTASR